MIQHLLQDFRIISECDREAFLTENRMIQKSKIAVLRNIYGNSKSFLRNKSDTRE